MVPLDIYSSTMLSPPFQDCEVYPCSNSGTGKVWPVGSIHLLVIYSPEAKDDLHS